MFFLGGNALSLLWATDFSASASSWLSFVHDLGEFPLLHTYAMDQIPYAIIVRRNPSNSLKTKKKVQIMPTKLINPDTKHHK